MELSIGDVKKCNAFKGDLKNAIDGMIDYWYEIAKKKGLTDHEAAEEALDKFGETLMKFDVSKPPPCPEPQ